MEDYKLTVKERNEAGITDHDVVQHTQDLANMVGSIKAYLDATQQVKKAKPLQTAEIVNACLESKRASVSPGSLRSYSDTWRTFAKWNPIFPTTPEAIENYLARFNSRRTANGVHQKLSLLYKFAADRHGAVNVVLKVDKPHYKTAEKASLTLDDARALLRACKTDRERGLVHLYLGHGLRRAEATRINSEDIQDGTLYVHGKCRDQYTPLLPETKEILLRLAGGKADGLVFRSSFKKRLSEKMAYLTISILLDRAGLDKGFTTHSLRHSFCTLSQDAGMSFPAAQRLMRHAGKTMTEAYTHLSDESLKLQLGTYSPIRLVDGRKAEVIPDYRKTTLPEEVLPAQTLRAQQRFPKVTYCGKTSLKTPSATASMLIPELLDKMIELGELAKRISADLGGNGHRVTELEDILNNSVEVKV